MTTIKLDVWGFVSFYKSRLVIWINEALPILLEELKRLTPENTWEMLDSYQIQSASMIWGSIVGIVWNTAWHAIYVERWQSWLVFNYHKPKWNVVFQWVGNRTFARAVDNTKDRILATILAAINR